MRVIIAGSRSISDESVVEDAFEESEFEWSEVDVLVNGGAKGVDSSAVDIVDDINLERCSEDEIEVDEYLVEDFVDEAPNRRVAPLLRNGEMAENADALVAVWDGESSGTEDMIAKARREGLDVFVYRTDNTTLDDFL